MTKLLIVSHDVVGSSMAGPGIRYWELARALAPHARVTLVAPRPIDIAAPGVTTASYAWGDAASLAGHLAGADLALVNGHLFEGHPELAEAAPALVVDLYDPTLLENLELLRAAGPAERAERTRRDVELLGRQLAAGDFFLCATERQRDLYIGALMAAGRITPAHVDGDPLLRGLIDVVPFGLPADPPARGGPAMRGAVEGVGPDDPIILWSGGLWDWMDPQTLIRAMPAVVAAIPNARLVFLAGRHPGPAAAMRTPAEARALAGELGLLGSHVFFYESWVPYGRRADFLLEAAVVVSLHRQHLETAYAAVRSRFLDHLWAGRASLVSAGDAAADLVGRHGLGRVAPIGDDAAVARLICDLLADEGEREACARRARDLAATFTWDRVSAPVRRFCAAPYRTRPIALPQQQQHEEPMPAGTSHDEAQQELLRRLEAHWKLGADQPSAGPAGALRRVLLRLIAPQLAEQREFNAALVRLFYMEHERAIRTQALAAQVLTLAAQIGDAHRRMDTIAQFDAEINDRVARLTHTAGLLNDAAASADELIGGLAGEVGQLKAALAAGGPRDA